MAAARMPPRYRSLLLTYPAAWRRTHGEYLLGILLEIHAESGRTAPSPAERLQFAAAGMRVQLDRLHRRHRTRQFVDLRRLSEFHSFDQENGLAPSDSDTPAAEQARANTAEQESGGTGMPQVSWGLIAFRG